MTLTNDGLLEVYFKDNANITEDSIEWVLQTGKKMTDVNVPALYSGGEFVSITKKGAAHQRKTHQLNPYSAKAVVVKNLAQRILADYYYKLSKNPYPMKIFKKEEDAIEWLKKYNQNSKRA